LKIGRHALNQLAELIAGAAPLRGDFFRSVAFRYFHPDDVVSGEGTRLRGGRLVPAGVRAVYASADEETAMREVTARKSALSGRKQIPVGEYPRITYVLSVTTRRNLNLVGKWSEKYSIFRTNSLTITARYPAFTAPVVKYQTALAHDNVFGI